MSLSNNQPHISPGRPTGWNHPSVKYEYGPTWRVKRRGDGKYVVEVLCKRHWLHALFTLRRYAWEPLTIFVGGNDDPPDGAEFLRSGQLASYWRYVHDTKAAAIEEGREWARQARQERSKEEEAVVHEEAAQIDARGRPPKSPTGGTGESGRPRKPTEPPKGSTPTPPPTAPGDA